MRATTIAALALAAAAAPALAYQDDVFARDLTPAQLRALAVLHAAASQHQARDFYDDVADFMKRAVAAPPPTAQPAKVSAGAASHVAQPAQVNPGAAKLAATKQGGKHHGGKHHGEHHGKHHNGKHHGGKHHGGKAATQGGSKVAAASAVHPSGKPVVSGTAQHAARDFYDDVADFVKRAVAAAPPTAQPAKVSAGAASHVAQPAQVNPGAAKLAATKQGGKHHGGKHHGEHHGKHHNGKHHGGKQHGGKAAAQGGSKVAAASAVHPSGKPLVPGTTQHAARSWASRRASDVLSVNGLRFPFRIGTTVLPTAGLNQLD